MAELEKSGQKYQKQQVSVDDEEAFLFAMERTN